jgi:hypothetical protein
LYPAVQAACAVRPKFSPLDKRAASMCCTSWPRTLDKLQFRIIRAIIRQFIQSAK